MGNGAARDELRRRINELDERIASPETRATQIYNTLKKEHPEYTEWDLICFCGNYLGRMVGLYPWLEEVMRPVSNLIYTAHYLDNSNTYGASDSGLTKIGNDGKEPKPMDRGFDAEGKPIVNGQRIITESGYIGRSGKDVK